MCLGFREGEKFLILIRFKLHFVGGIAAVKTFEMRERRVMEDLESRLWECVPLEAGIFGFILEMVVEA